MRMRKNYMSTNFTISKNKWNKDIAQSTQRNYSFKSVSGDNVDLLYYPDKNDDNYCKNLTF